MTESVPSTQSPIVHPVQNDTATVNSNVEGPVIAFASLVAMALVCIILGGIRSHSSLKRLQTKKNHLMISIQTKLAVCLPVLFSIALFGFYICIRSNKINEVVHQHAFSQIPENLLSGVDRALDSGTKLVNRMKNIFSFLRYFVTVESLITLAVFERLHIENYWPSLGKSYCFNINRRNNETEKEGSGRKRAWFIKVDGVSIIALILCFSLSYWHHYHHNWITNNIVYVLYSIYIIEIIHLVSFKAGSILLVGLFLYDIFWVFCTDVMVTVALSTDAPHGLLMVPYDFLLNGGFNADKHGCLGLGDIIVPGIYLALLYRFDNHIFVQSKDQQKPRYYFVTTLVAYMVGLVLANVFCYVYRAAQPALLYIVPCCLLTPLILAFFRGELSQLVNYSEYILTTAYAKKMDKNKNKALAEKKSN